LKSNKLFFLYPIPIIDLLLFAAICCYLLHFAVTLFLSAFAHGLVTAYLRFTISFSRVRTDRADAVFASFFADACGNEATEPWIEFSDVYWSGKLSET
jgi:hypothetical protein